ncbi:MAG TPA: V-type ATP synthase subunit E family protein [Syntrophorhabdaceae bacterium]|nr:V-type ATP synthase subunit E family protein [Syntrophorhabdaceae bacterium]HOT42166.1 V-type ATP synthase subunit E family protein [Syntrophorhabdaceae bacterium]HPC67328.1 V-type ATP synthase subunit E family protein [Syntrophorhabdaceae bacterium]HQE80435.1 V-type ATP synthase subunit E family protein [Syntrophorhabdaceae bacterium]HQH42875.1 V-type ATP synthase subunit E family protein [Syntrophorhabdaceae bacterium]
MTTEQNSTERLREEILADAKRKAEEIISSARQEAEGILSNAEAESKRIRQEIIDQAKAEADRRSELVLASVPVETGRLRGERIESLLESVYEEASKRILDSEEIDLSEVLVNLASDAISKMSGDFFILRFSGTKQNISGDELVQRILERIGKPLTITVSEERDIASPGIIIEDNEGRQIWDNRLLERLKRLWPEMRRKIATEAGFISQKE